MTTTGLDLTQWEKAGFVHFDRLLMGLALAGLQAWIDCRTENVVSRHRGLRTLLTEGTIVRMASDLLGEPAVLYQETVDYKYPGAGEFAAHQAAAADPFVSGTVTGILAIDDATVENGCVQLAPGLHHAMLPLNDEGFITPKIADILYWVAVPLAAGSLLWFHGLTPHRSAPNRSSRPYRALHLTYHAASEGHSCDVDQRRALARMGGTTGSRAERLGVIGDFQRRRVVANGDRP